MYIAFWSAMRLGSLKPVGWGNLAACSRPAPHYRLRAKRGHSVLGLPYSPVRLAPEDVGSSRVDLQACKLEYSIVSPK